MQPGSLENIVKTGYVLLFDHVLGAILNDFIGFKFLFFLFFITGHGFTVESHIGRISLSNSRFYDNRGNGVKAKLLDGKFAIVDLKRTFCERPGVDGRQAFPRLMTGTRREYTENGVCGQVGTTL